jgi:hypothetical protein
MVVSNLFMRVKKSICGGSLKNKMPLIFFTQVNYILEKATDVA